MKKIYSLAFSTLVAFMSLSAQTPCSTGRYAADTFTAYTTSSNVVYGSNINSGGSTQSLKMDIYEPTGDVETARPLIIWAHGGSFQTGSSTDGDVTALSQAFAKKGYVCASINYRLGFFPLDSINAIKAVVRAVQDMKASIRFFYKDRLTTNTYKIDTNNIFIGGSSAGAITALHTAYLDKTCEINYYLTPSIVGTLGGIDGYSGNQCYSSKVKGVINLCGALGRYGWLEAGDIPFCSMHGTADGTVKYNRGMVNPGVPIILLDGSRMLKEQANAVGVNNPFYTWYGQNHVPYSSNTAYMDTTIRFVRDYLISRLGCTDAALLPQNTPAQTATLYSYTGCTANVLMTCDVPGFVGVNELTKASVITNVFPNPSDNDMTVEFSNTNTTHRVELFDVTGKTILSESTDQSSYKIKKNNVAGGLYFLKVTSKAGESTTQKVVFK
ncbi:MAG: T9SS type A sorting domain-containing protein [Bacteroidetes bacterium]|nr:T9SS type A sorting domain-containing protein [Bacteroidota bacterium]